MNYILCFFLRSFRERIYKIMDDIKELKKKINDYKGNKVNTKEEIEK